MGQSSSSASSSSPPIGRSTSHPSSNFPGRAKQTSVMLPCLRTVDFSGDPSKIDAFLLDLVRDRISDLPDECLALIFNSLGPADRKRCSLVCHRWLLVEGQSRQRLSLDACSGLLVAAPALFTRFDSVSKLALKCDRSAESIGDEVLTMISLQCPQLTRLKLRACREITDVGMVELAKNCKNLRKLSCGSCAFGARGIFAVVSACPLLEEISIKRLRGLTGGADEIVAPVNSSLRSICLKDLYNGQCFGPVIAGSPSLTTLKIFRCSGDWNGLLEEITGKVPALIELHLEKLQISDRGLIAFTACLQLEIIHLVKTLECTDVGLATIAGCCRLLRKIHIDGWKTNRIGDEGLLAVANSCANLQELVLIGVNLTTLSVARIAENCKNLERLAMCASNTIGDAEISCIASKCFALKKLCIKGCPVSNQGMEALAEGCPNLVKVKVKKCRAVTIEGAEWLRASRESLAVYLDVISSEVLVDQVDQVDASASDSSLQDNGDEQFPAQIDGNSVSTMPSSSNAQSALSKARLRFLTGRNLLSCTIRKLSRSNRNENHPKHAPDKPRNNERI